MTKYNNSNDNTLSEHSRKEFLNIFNGSCRCLGRGARGRVLTQTDSHRFVPLLGFRKGLKRNAIDKIRFQNLRNYRYQQIIGNWVTAIIVNVRKCIHIIMIKIRN